MEATMVAAEVLVHRAMTQISIFLPCPKPLVKYNPSTEAEAVDAAVTEDAAVIEVSYYTCTIDFY